MPFKSISRELLSLTEDTREHLTYLRELGVESLEDLTGQPAPTVSERIVSSPQAASAPPSSSFRAPDNFPLVEKSIPQFQTTQRPTKPAVTPLPQDTLFGDIFVKEEDRLPESSETFDQIWADVGNCTRCPLCHGRTNIVHTEGNRNGRLMFVGEAPGADEDAQARPFVGRAGQLLTKIIEALGMKREEVLIGNVNRCRPPGNRAPTTEEAAMCKPFLLREIAAARPEVIVVLGNTAMKNLLEIREGITRVRGRFQDFKGIKVMPTFHPAFLLRDPSKKRETWDDLKKVRDYLDSTRGSS
jgi:uracil-DNA glycosylase family 4